ncbi:MAG: S9 family peptidase, partial [Bacteroidia bacterium]
MRRVILAGLLILFTIALTAQKKQYESLMEAFMSGSSLRGDPGPSGVEWIKESDKYSFTKREGRSQQIWTHDIISAAEVLVFNEQDHVFPGTEQPFRYRSFQWTRDYRFLLFQTNFQPIWRYSGNADYYLY